MDQEAQDRFAWRMFLGLVQCIFAIHAVHNFITPHPLLSTELCFAAFLITFFALVVELNGNPTRRSFRVQASTEDAEGRWSVTLERERRQREIVEEMGYGPHPLDHHGNRLLAMSNQERVAIEVEARLILDELALQNGQLTPAQQSSLERSISWRYRTRQQITPTMHETIQGSELQLVPRVNWTADDILQSLPSPSRSSGKFIGLTDASDRHYPIHFQVNHPFEAPPTYIDSTTQQNVIESNLHPFRRQVGISQHPTSTLLPHRASEERGLSNASSSSTIRGEVRPQLRIRIPEQQESDIPDIIYSDTFPGPRSGTTPATPASGGTLSESCLSREL